MGRAMGSRMALTPKHLLSQVKTSAAVLPNIRRNSQYDTVKFECLPSAPRPLVSRFKSLEFDFPSHRMNPDIA